jgi:hypothetical protein
MANMEKKTRGRPKIYSGRKSDMQFHFRFIDPEHQKLVLRAFEKSKLPSMRAWMIQATLTESRRQLGLAE